MHCIVLLMLFLHSSYAYSFGVITSGGLPLEFSNENLKRAVPRAQMTGVFEIPDEMRDAIHGVKMGVASDICDNAKDNLDIDWDGSPVNYTCFHPKNPMPIIKDLESVEECNLPKSFYPKHACMNERIEYDTAIPTYGNHRPLWPVYGEYAFVPPQRWVHNLEHGAIVMLYHPCVEPLEVERLRQLVKGCLHRHIITPYTLLPVDRPLALVAWGCKLLMNHVDENTVIKFIKEKALHGPEYQLAKQGQYRFKLQELAVAPKGSTYSDLKLCPNA